LRGTTRQMWKLRRRGQRSEAWKSQCNCHPGASNASGHRSCALLAMSRGSVHPSRHAHAAQLCHRIDIAAGRREFGHAARGGNEVPKSSRRR
jgi:hypothetical protein